MPDFLEAKLRQQARKKGLSGRKADRYTYGAMNNLGAMHGNKITAKGREMEKKHEADTMKSEGKAGSHRMREMRIEHHYDKGGKLTGYTVHHSMEPSKASKSGAFMEHHSESYPFGAGDHESMVDHVEAHLGGAAKSAAGAGEKEVEENE